MLTPTTTPMLRHDELEIPEQYCPGRQDRQGSSAAQKNARGRSLFASAKLRTTCSMASNGEVEGRDDHTGRAPRAHTLSRRPRRQTEHASRPPPTIVRQQSHRRPSAPMRENSRTANTGTPSPAPMKYAIRVSPMRPTSSRPCNHPTRISRHLQNNLGAASAVSLRF